MEDRFRNRFWTNFERFSGMKNEQKCGRVCLFLSFGVLKMSPNFDSNLEASWASFSEVFGWPSKNGLERKKRFFRRFFGCLQKCIFLMRFEKW